MRSNQLSYLAIFAAGAATKIGFVAHFSNKAREKDGPMLKNDGGRLRGIHYFVTFVVIIVWNSTG